MGDRSWGWGRTPPPNPNYLSPMTHHLRKRFRLPVLVSGGQAIGALGERRCELLDVEVLAGHQVADELDHQAVVLGEPDRLYARHAGHLELLGEQLARVLL